MQIIKTSSFNTNNAWGFGGSVGTDTYYDNGIMIRKARKYHRHTGTSSDSRIYVQAKDDFYIPLRRSVKSYTDVLKLDGVTTISVLECNDHYQALIGDIEEVLIYDNKPHKRIKKIEL